MSSENRSNSIATRLVRVLTLIEEYDADLEDIITDAEILIVNKGNKGVSDALSALKIHYLGDRLEY